MLQLQPPRPHCQKLPVKEGVHQTTTTTTPVIIRAATIPTATLTTEKAVENTPHAAPARRQTTLRTDASIRRSTRKLKRPLAAEAKTTNAQTWGTSPDLSL